MWKKILKCECEKKFINENFIRNETTGAGWIRLRDSSNWRWKNQCYGNYSDHFIIQFLNMVRYKIIRSIIIPTMKNGCKYIIKSIRDRIAPKIMIFVHQFALTRIPIPAITNDNPLSIHKILIKILKGDLSRLSIDNNHDWPNLEGHQFKKLGFDIPIWPLVVLRLPNDWPATIRPCPIMTIPIKISVIDDNFSTHSWI